jgi:hypothetical protein
MSLINDALKRAGQIQQRQPPPPAAPPRELPTVTGKSHAIPGWMLPVLVILLIAAAGAFIARAFFSEKPPVQIARTVSVPQPVQVIPPAPKTSPPPAPSPAVAVTAPTPSPPPAPQPPILRVQGISYSNAKWQAIVNGTTVYVGDCVNGFRIAEISRNNVAFIAPDGSQKTLALGAH